MFLIDPGLLVHLWQHMYIVGRFLIDYSSLFAFKAADTQVKKLLESSHCTLLHVFMKAHISVQGNVHSVVFTFAYITVYPSLLSSCVFTICRRYKGYGKTLKHALIQCIIFFEMCTFL